MPGCFTPTEILDDDGLTSFDPNTDGLDFYESLEGMRVTIDAPLVVANTNGNGESWVVASGGAGLLAAARFGGDVPGALTTAARQPGADRRCRVS